MNVKPYAVEINCPISNRSETVFFYEVPVLDEIRLQFNGCDNNWHKCEECQACQKKAYSILESSVK